MSDNSDHDEQEHTTHRVVELLEELLVWTKFANHEDLAEALQRQLDDRASFQAYRFSDGTRSQYEVAKASGVSQPTVSRMWSQWRRRGLVRDVGGRVGHLADPADLGLTAPE